MASKHGTASQGGIIVIKRVRGFTLLEAMVSVTIIAIIATIATPFLSSRIQKQNVRASNQFGLKAFNTARTQAMVVDSASTYVCWNLSDTPITMADADTSYNLLPGAIIVAEGVAGDFDEIITSGVIRGDAGVVFDNDADDCISFDAQGRMVDSTNAALFAMIFCHAEGDVEDARRLEINAGGRVSIKLNTDTTGLGPDTCT